MPRYTYSRLPAGVTADAQGNITGTFTTPGVYSVQVTLTLDIFTVRKTLKLTILPNGPAPGIFWGHLPRGEGSSEPAAVMLDVGPSGAYTGSLWVGTARTPVAGTLIPTPDVVTPDRPYPVKFQGVSQVWWLRCIHPEVYQFYIRPATLPSDGTGTDGNVLGLVSFIRNRGFVTDSANTGRFNFGLRGDINDSEAAGHGFGSLNILPSGLATCIGQLPDGSSLTGSAWLDENAVPHFHFADTRTRSVLHQGDSASEFCFWHRPPTPGRLYPAGIFDKQFSFLPSRYRAQARQPLLEGADHQLRLNVPGTFLPDTSVTLTTAHTARFGPGEENPLQARMDIYAPTGFFTGQFTLRDANPSSPAARPIVRTVYYRGILLQEQAQDLGIGLGNFLVPALPDPQATPPTSLTTSPILSGSVLLETNGLQ